MNSLRVEKSKTAAEEVAALWREGRKQQAKENAELARRLERLVRDLRKMQRLMGEFG